MTEIGPMPAGPSGQAPLARPSFRILGRAHASVAGLFDAVSVLDDKRRAGNTSTKGRMSRVEVDVLRSALVLTSAGLDAAMKRLVNDVGRALVLRPSSGARRQFEEYLKSELAKPQVSGTFRCAVIAFDQSESLIDLYLGERAKSSFQGSSDLKVRVRQTLGISKSDVPDSEIERLDEFFLSRNKIVHEMDLNDPSSKSTARVHRRKEKVAAQCSLVFEVGTALICGAAAAARKVGV